MFHFYFFQRSGAIFVNVCMCVWLFVYVLSGFHCCLIIVYYLLVIACSQWLCTFRVLLYLYFDEMIDVYGVYPHLDIQIHLRL